MASSREPRPAPASARVRALIGFASAIVAASVLAPAALAGGSEPAAPTAISLNAPAQAAGYNDPVALTGSVTPAAAGIEVVLQRAEGAGKTLTSGLTAADGTFSLSISLKTPESLVAIALASGATSAPIDFKLRPRLAARVRKAAAFAEAKVSITVDPHGATGTANITVKRNGKTVQRVQARVRNGRASKAIVTPGPGAYKVIVDFDAPNGYAAASATVTGRATTRVLKVGSKGNDVAGLIRKLGSLSLHVPPR